LTFLGQREAKEGKKTKAKEVSWGKIASRKGEKGAGVKGFVGKSSGVRCYQKSNEQEGHPRTMVPSFPIPIGCP